MSGIKFPDDCDTYSSVGEGTPHESTRRTQKVLMSSINAHNSDLRTQIIVCHCIPRSHLRELPRVCTITLLQRKSLDCLNNWDIPRHCNTVTFLGKSHNTNPLSNTYLALICMAAQYQCCAWLVLSKRISLALEHMFWSYWFPSTGAGVLHSHSVYNLLLDPVETSY